MVETQHPLDSFTVNKCCANCTVLPSCGNLAKLMLTVKTKMIWKETHFSRGRVLVSALLNSESGFGG